MNKEAQRIAIAEACVTSMWCCRCSGRSEDGVRATLMRYGAPFCSDKCAEAAGDYDIDDGQQSIPDYPADLNAMHEAEKVLSEKPDNGLGSLSHGNPKGRYLHRLVEVCGDSFPIYATASQRAEAFLRTLNLWTPSP